jgi:methylenetetrahydrofolate reductase (NADPH)
MAAAGGEGRKFSFEFYPPKTAEGAAKLQQTVKQLGQLRPDFFSVTYGAGGSTREGTLNTVLSVREAGHAAAGEFRYASELVRFIRELTGDWFHIEVAAYPEYHPQARRAQQDLAAFKAKIDAGADAAITQYFYNPDSYFHFVEQAQALGIRVPIVPGIMPINNFTQLARFSDACGAEIPRWMRLKLEGYGDDVASIKAFGLDVVTQLCDRLLEGGAPGLHVYTMNQAGPTSTLWQRLGL